MFTNISSKNNDLEELEVIEIIKSLCIKYNLPAFTQNILVEKGAVPHSHPILTLGTKVKDERSVLKTLVHEQFHWYAEEHPRYEECIAYLKTKNQDDGEHNKSGTYPNSYWEHIIVCFNTRNYLKSILSTEELSWIYTQWQAYPTLEKLIVDKYEEIESDLNKFNIILLN